MRKLLKIDKSLLLFARTRFHQEPVERAIKAYSDLGEYGVIWSVFALGGAIGDRERRQAWLRAAAVAPAALAVNYVAKTLVKRKRPKIRGLRPLTHTTSSLSFPSAHAAMAFSAGHVISKLTPEARWHVAAAATAMAASRPYLGMHYPSDVLAGAVLGSVIGLTAERWVLGRGI